MDDDQGAFVLFDPNGSKFVVDLDRVTASMSTNFAENLGFHLLKNHGENPAFRAFAHELLRDAKGGQPE